VIHFSYNFGARKQKHASDESKNTTRRDHAETSQVTD